MSGMAAFHSNIDDQEPAYQDFLNWLEECAVPGTCGATATVNSSFVPSESLKRYFVTRRLVELLKAVYPGRSQLPVSPSVIQTNGFCKIFAILLVLGKGRFISDFVHHRELSDGYLPFTAQPRHFPKAVYGHFFDDFYNAQWKFCARELRDMEIEQKLEDDCILPIIKKEEIARGVSAVVYKITLHESYDELTAETATESSAHTYALKTYHDVRDAHKYYKSEVEAFKKLTKGNQRNPHVIGFHGSFEQAGRYHILLEYANAGTLEQYFEKIPPPTSNEDIISFWSQLSGIAHALMSVHQVRPDDTLVGPRVLRGWHQDIKPDNILIINRDDASLYKSIFKLADLGTSHFKHFTIDEEAEDRHNLGTRDYGAPECYSGEIGDRGMQIVRQNVDIWSLGCIFSEAAVWVSLGAEGLRTYRRYRRAATSRLHGFQDSECFHDGSVVLDVVTQMHLYLERSTDTCDNVTKEVSSLVRRDMLTEGWVRSSARAVYEKLRQCLIQADVRIQSLFSDPHAPFQNQDVRSVTGDASSAMMLPLELPPEVPGLNSYKMPHTPPQDGYGSPSSGIGTPSHPSGLISPPLSAFHVNQGFSNQPQGLSPLNRISNATMQTPTTPKQRRHCSTNSRGEFSGSGMIRQSSHSWHDPGAPGVPGSALSLNDHHRPLSDSQIRSHFASMDLNSQTSTSSFPYPTQTSMTSPMNMTAQTHDPRFSYYTNEGVPDQAYMQHPDYTPPPQHSQSRGLNPWPGMTPSALSHSTSTRHQPQPLGPPWSHAGGSSHQNGLPGYPDYAREDRDARMNYGSSRTTDPRVSESSFGGSLRHRPSQSTRAQRNPLTPIQTSTSIPAVTRPGFTRNRPSELAFKDAWIWYRKCKAEGHVSLSDENHLMELQNRDMVFLIDDSVTMRPYWQEVQRLFAVLGYLVKKTDKDGIELLFTAPGTNKNKTTAPLIRILENMGYPNSSLDFQKRLSEILRDYEARLRHWNTNKSSRFSFKRCTCPPPLSLYVLTNGEWQHHTNPRNITSVSEDIRRLVDTLVELKLPTNQVGIQFIRFGNSLNGADRLQHLDSRLGLARDIVDTEPSAGDVWKMLLGPTNKVFDEDDEPHELGTASAITPSGTNGYHNGWTGGQKA